MDMFDVDDDAIRAVPPRDVGTSAVLRRRGFAYCECLWSK
jgi:hypothetical protein